MASPVNVEQLMKRVRVDNCLSILNFLLTHPHQQEATELKAFIRAKWEIIMKKCPLDDLSILVMKFMIDNWRQTEYSLFLYIKKWLDVEFKKRKDHIDELLSQVRFSLMEKDELVAIEQMDIYKQSSGQWWELILRAKLYLDKPIHQRVIDRSVQTQVRNDPAVVVITTGHWVKESRYFVMDCEERFDWTEHDALDPPKFIQTVHAYLEVNNFLVYCSDFTDAMGKGDEEDNSGQPWYIFDPLFNRWHKMQRLLIARTNFALVSHVNKLYCLGGMEDISYGIESGTDTAEMFDFETGQWCHIGKLPQAVTHPSGCVIKDFIYLVGGLRCTLKSQIDCMSVDCYDIRNETWHKKASMISPKGHHRSHVISVKGKDMIVTIDCEFDMEVYNPEFDQWSKGSFSFIHKALKDKEWGFEGFMIGEGNSLYFIDIRGEDLPHKTYQWPEPPQYREEWDYPRHKPEPEPELHVLGNDFFQPYQPQQVELSPPYKEEQCIRWDFSEDGKTITEYSLPNFPIAVNSFEPGVPDEPGVSPLGAVLRIPAYRPRVK